MPVLPLNLSLRNNSGRRKRKLDMTLVEISLSNLFGIGKKNTVTESIINSEDMVSLSIGTDLPSHLMNQDIRLLLKLS